MTRRFVERFRESVAESIESLEETVEHWESRVEELLGTGLPVELSDARRHLEKAQKNLESARKELLMDDADIRYERASRNDPNAGYWN